MVSDKQLSHWYAKYNREWFAGELPHDTVIWWEPPSDSQGITCPVYEVRDGKFEVRLDPSLKGVPDYWHLLLIHEMVHIKLWPIHNRHQHGKVFQQEMIRLALAGAFKTIW